jgi:hypothetical protein
MGCIPEAAPNSPGKEGRNPNGIYIIISPSVRGVAPWRDKPELDK